MKYMILVYGSQHDYDALADDGSPTAAQGLSAINEFLTTFTSDLADSGELVEAQGLSAPVLARRVRVRDGAPLVTDGPFAETEEVLAGYWIVDCAGLDRATEIAARLERAPGRHANCGTVIRPCMGPETELEH